MHIRRKQSFFYHLFFISSLFVCFSALADTDKPDFEITPKPEWIQFKQVDVKPIENEQSSETYLAYEVFRDLSQQDEIYTFHLSAQVNNTQGIEELSQVYASFYPTYETVQWHSIDIIRDGKVTSRLNRDDFNVFQPEDDIDSKIYDEEWRVLSVIKDVRVGDIVSYSYSVIGQNPIFGDHKLGRVSLSFGVPLEYTNLIIRTQKQQPLYFKMHNFQAEMQNFEKDGLTYYQLEQHNIPAYVSEDYMPESEVISRSLEFSSFKNWSEVNKWAQALYDDKYQLDELLKKHAQEWKKASASKIDYANQAIEFVQKDIRYWGIETGVNSHLPSFPSETAARRYGDCKDKAVLLTALLRDNGIEAYPALVSGSKTSFVFERLATPSAFDHAITTFFIDGKQYWIDGTIDSQGTQLANITHPDYKGALVIRDGESQLSTMEPGSDSQYINDLNVSHEYLVDSAKDEVTLRIVSVYRGGIADSMRRYTNTNTTQKIDNNSLQYFSTYYDSIEIAKPSTVVDDPKSNTVTHETHFLIKNAGEDKSARVEYFFYLPELREYSFLPNNRARHQAYELLYPFDFTSKMTVKTVDEQKPLWSSYTSFEKDYGEFSLAKEGSLTGAVVVQEMTYVNKADRVEPEAFDSFKKALETTLNNAGVEVWLPKNTATQSSTKKRVKSLMQNILKRNQK